MAVTREIEILSVCELKERDVRPPPEREVSVTSELHHGDVDARVCLSSCTTVCSRGVHTSLPALYDANTGNSISHRQKKRKKESHFGCSKKKTKAALSAHFVSYTHSKDVQATHQTSSRLSHPQASRRRGGEQADDGLHQGARVFFCSVAASLRLPTCAFPPPSSP